MRRIAVLASGGLDSAVLLADLARADTVFPVYVAAGLAWEAREQDALRAYLDAVACDNLKPLTVLDMPSRGLYGGEHWSVSGNAPAYDAPDETVYIPGRNVLLIGVAAVWGALNGVEAIAIGSLEGNPFPDATPAFFQDYGRLLSAALDHHLTVLAPYRQQHKSRIIARFPYLPLHLTLTCMAPRERDGEILHCGACNKCRERREAFRDANVPDLTRYAA
jgi:7-cyano-7-deazaguanine synthase